MIFLVLKFLCRFSFWTPDLPDGVLSNRPCLSAHVSVSELSQRPFISFFYYFAWSWGTIRVQKWQSPIIENIWSQWGRKPILGVFFKFLTIFLDLVIKMFWNFMYVINSTLFNTSRKLCPLHAYILHNFFFHQYIFYPNILAPGFTQEGP